MNIFIVTFRETLEAAIIIGLIFSMLRVFKVTKYKKRIIIGGIILGIILSFIVAYAFEYFFGSFEGKSEKIYEGVLMLLASAMITQFLIWTHTSFNNVGKKIKKSVDYIISSGQLWMLGFLACASVLREGVETVIFLNALDFSARNSDLILAFLGIIAAIMAAYVLFFSLKKINIKKVIFFTNIFFMFIAAGLLAHGIVEFQGAGYLNFWNHILYDISHILSEKQGIGAILKAGLSYDANPTLLAFVCYVLYIFTICYYLFFRKGKK